MGWRGRVRTTSWRQETDPAIHCPICFAEENVWTLNPRSADEGEGEAHVDDFLGGGVHVVATLFTLDELVAESTAAGLDGTARRAAAALPT